jgi:hypothetical protein
MPVHRSSTQKGVNMNIDETLVRLDSVCRRLEDALAELGRVAEKRPGPYAKVRETHPNAGKPWSNADDDELRRLFTSGNSIEDLALLFGRTPNGIRVRLERLGLIQPWTSSGALQHAQDDNALPQARDGNATAAA